MKISNVGYSYRHPSDFCIDRPHGSGDYILLLIRTAGFYVLRGERMEIAPNSVLIFQPGTQQLYGASGGEYVNDWIHFDLEDNEREELSALGIPFDTVLSLYEAADISDFIKSIYRERYSQNTHKEASMKHYFDLILLKLSERIGAEKTQREHPLYPAFSALRNDIYLEPQGEWGIDRIAKRMNLSRSYLQHLYKNFFDRSIVSDVQHSRMEHAKYLLSATDMTVGSIAQSCGYDTDVHFMRIFKKTVQMTPSQFRKEFRIAPAEVRKSQSEKPFSIVKNENGNA